MTMKAEEFTRIVGWVITGVLAGFGLTNDSLLFNLAQPEVVAAASGLILAVWRAFRPPV